MTRPAPLDEFRRVLAGASRAIARDRELDIAFAAEPGPATGKTARVPSPGASLEPRLVAEARGAADAAALRLRYHDAAIHRSSVPVEAEASAVFEALETVRVEALGARAMDGVKGNLDILAEARIRSDAIGRARTAEEVPLATAVGLIARQRLTGAEPPAAARAGLKLVADWIEEKAGAELDALALTIDDQQAYATLSRRLLEDLELETAPEPVDQESEEGGDEEEAEEPGTDENEDSDEEASAGDGEMEMRREEQEGDDDSPSGEEEAEGEETSAGEDGSDSAQPRAARRNWADPLDSIFNSMPTSWVLQRE
jgi:cobaltochelatase CobT